MGFAVPRGLIHGPIALNKFINGILSVFENANIICFADDTAVFLSETIWILT